ncbi:MAG: hypothetical protein ACTH31_12215, partial [Pseudoclavibacter sp.]
MRFILAGIAFLVSLVCFGLGAWQIVQAQSSDRVTVTGSSSADAPLVVVPSDTLVDHTGSQTITIQGDGPIVAVVGRQGDVAGWVADTTHSIAEVDDESGALTFSVTEGGEVAAPSPAGSDLWYEEYTGEGTLEFETSLPPGFSLLVASDGEAAAPAELSVSWPLDGRAPWSGPLFVAGIVFLLVALGMLLWALLSMRSRGRRRSGDEGPIALRPSTSPISTDAVAEADADADPTAGAEADETGGGQHPSAAHSAETGEILPAPASHPGAKHDGGDEFAPVPDAEGTHGAHVTSATTAFAMPNEPLAPSDIDDATQADSDWASPTGAWAAPSEPAGLPPHGAAPSSDDDAPAIPPVDDPWAGVSTDAAPGQAGPFAPQTPAAEAAFGQPNGADAPAPGAPPLASHPLSHAGRHAGSATDATGAFGASDATAASGASDATAASGATNVPEATTASEPAYGIRTEQPSAPDDGTDHRDDTGDSDDRDDTGDGDDSNGPGSGNGPSAGTPSAPGGASGDESTQWKRPRGRDRSKAPKRAFRLAAILLVGGLGLTGCSATMWPEALGGTDENPTATPTSTIDEALIEEGAPLPAINQEQLTRILDDARTVADEADAAGDAAGLDARFGGAALAAREASYQATGADGELSTITPFPAGEVVYAVPQATNEWPRTVFVVVEMGDAGAEGAAPAGIMLEQASARAPYRVESL